MIRSFGVIACLLAVSCSTPDNSSAKTPGGATLEKRDTEIKHEPCDVGSSSATAVDVNGDKKPDIIHVMDGKHEVCRAVDLNLDGAVDSFIYYDAQGRIRRIESDFDRDGRADEIDIYENGEIKTKLRETNFDNKIDTWDYYEHGRLVRRERDTDADGIVDQWWQFNNPTNPKCAIVASDHNADGKPDPDSVTDLCGESYGAPKPATPPPAAAPSTTPSASPSTSAPVAPVAPPSAIPPASSAQPKAPGAK